MENVPNSDEFTIRRSASHWVRRAFRVCAALTSIALSPRCGGRRRQCDVGVMVFAFARWSLENPFIGDENSST